MVEKILNNTTPYGKIRASHEGSLHSSTLNHIAIDQANCRWRHSLNRHPSFNTDLKNVTLSTYIIACYIIYII